MTTQMAPWWKTSTVYQVYPRSFQDSNGDGVGDLPGIISRLPYLAELGIEVLWLSPVYRSPMKDNGYDISDYEDIDPLFGTLEDMDALLARAHELGIRVVMDLVVNHTSDEHPWFVESLDPASPRRDWYVWRSRRTECVADASAGPGQWRGDEPNRWVSAFSGPVWQWHEASGEYYLHFFAPGQPDLNWENPDVRQAVYAMMRGWLDRGVDGFRMDVINCISKVDNLYDDTAGGLEKSFFGPRFHEFMQEMRREVFDAYPGRVFFTVGETPGATVEEARLMTAPERRELDMVFQFEHMSLDATDGDKFQPKPLRLPDMKKNLARWSGELAGSGWNSLYLSNHDQPRPASRYGSSRPEFRHRSAQAWAAMLHAHQGTPFVYQGEELGMGNFPWSDISQFNDVETIGLWRERVVLAGENPDEVWAGVVRASRDNARTPVQWDASAHAGFTTGTPWLPVNPDHVSVNAAAQVGVEGSTFEFYKSLIAVRKTMSVLVEGSFELLEADHPQLWWVRRRLGDVVLDVVANMSDEAIAATAITGEILVTNVEGADRVEGILAPWEARWVVRR